MKSLWQINGLGKKIPSCSNSALVHYAHECTNTIAAVAFYIPRRMSRTLAKTNFAPKMGKKEKEIVLQREKKQKQEAKIANDVFPLLLNVYK